MSINTPIRSPRVSHEPVVISITNDFNTVIKISSTIWWVKNTTTIELENSWIGFNTNWYWLLSNSSSQLIVIFGCNFSITGWSKGNFFLRVLTFLISCLVFIVLWQLNTISFNIIISFRKISTITSPVFFWAIYNLLFTETQEFSWFNGI